MTISRIASGFANANSISIPSHNAGDLILLYALRISTATAITAASGWKLLSSRVTNSIASRTAWCVSSGSVTTSGTWTNAEWMAYVIYRDSVNYLIPGSVGVQGNTGGTTVQYAASTITDTAQIVRSNDSTSWFSSMVIIRSGGDAAACTTAPSGMTNFASQSGVAGLHDTNATASGWSTTTPTGFTTTTYHTAVIEVLDSGVSKSSGLSPQLINSQTLVRGIVI